MTYSELMKVYNKLGRYYDSVRLMYDKNGYDEHLNEMEEIDELMSKVKHMASIEQQTAWNEANRKTDELRRAQGLPPIYGH